MTSKEKVAFWQCHIKAWQESKLPQKAYCQQHDISFASFGYWRTRLNRKTAPKTKLIPVGISKPFSSINIFLPNGIKLEVPTHELTDVLRALHTAQGTP